MKEHSDNFLNDQDESDDLYQDRILQVDPGQGPERIDKYITDKLIGISRNKVQAAIKAGAVTIDDKPIKSNYKLKGGESIKLIVPKQDVDHSKVLAEPIPLDIMYEDDHLMVINKPAGMVVHPAIGNWTGTLLNALAWHLHPEKPADNQPFETEPPGLVHRIDKDTSGVMIVPKTDHSASHLGKQFYDHTIERKYLALVWGSPEPEDGTIEGYIARHAKNRLIYTVIPEEDRGKHAITHYKTIQSYYYVSLVECQLETGRTHQIRVHMKSIGHPLFADEKYGGMQIRKGTVFTKYKQFVQNCFGIMSRQALHARSLGFIHPNTGKHMLFETDLPNDFQQVMDKWEHYLTYRKNNM